MAGEIGHIVLQSTGPRCRCGSRGCLEALASGTAIARSAEEFAATSPRSPLGRRQRERGSLTAVDVGLVAAEGDAAARGIIRKAGWYLGLGIGSLLNVLSVEIVIVGGGLTALGDDYIGQAREAAAAHSYVQRLRPAPIVVGLLADTAGVIGAGVLALDLARHRVNRP